MPHPFAQKVHEKSFAFIPDSYQKSPAESESVLTSVDDSSYEHSEGSFADPEFWEYSMIHHIEESPKPPHTVYLVLGADADSPLSMLATPGVDSELMFCILSSLLKKASELEPVKLLCREARTIISEILFPKELKFFQNKFDTTDYLFTHYAAASLPYVGRIYVGFRIISFYGSALFKTYQWTCLTDRVTHLDVEGHTLTIKTTDKILYRLTIAKADNCLRDLMVMLYHRWENMVFACPIQPLKHRYNNAVPTLVSKCFDYCLAHASENPFHKSGDAQVIDEYVLRIDHGEEVDFANADVHNVADLLLRFFGDMPRGLLDFRILVEGDVAESRDALASVTAQYAVLVLKCICEYLPKFDMTDQLLDAWGDALGLKKHLSLLKFLIDNCQDLFSENK